jgi:twitching motility protein PilT
LTEKPRGLVLITGPTGSGKSTTLAALIDEINRKRSEHILTIEDPVEFVHRHKRCIVNQREIGPDATSFAEAPARGARARTRRDLARRDARPRDDSRLRLPPRRRVTWSSRRCTPRAHRAPSTGSSTLSQPPSRSRYACSSPRRCREVVPDAAARPGGSGRVPALEILFPDDAVRNLIRQGKVEQVYSVMQTGTSKGMQTMEQSLADLVLRRVIAAR